MLVAAFSLSASAFAPTLLTPGQQIEAAIQPMVESLSKKYDCAISVAMQGAGESPLKVAVVAVRPAAVNRSLRR